MLGARESEKGKPDKYSFFWQKDPAGMRFKSRTGPFFLSMLARGCLRNGQGTRGRDRISCCANEVSREENRIVRCRERNTISATFRAKQCL